MKETTGKVVTSEGLTGIYLSPLIHFHRSTDLLKHIGEPIGRALEESLTDMGIIRKYYTPLVNFVDDHQGFCFDLRSSRIDSTDLQLSRLDP
ncbi:uncharacterized protein EAF02_001033 [Botrytis sinoallii]|uniref:uncharacterized protein n=1 Tax=Botrytis sinoallii TaxID=1463999 RepID=UPI0019014752|nr:uncharacterized protein EAF02_001033 [Botrytis sinoallii]KAF7893495.1 hypothetical protein EAF02_001033 [Botrytis sinoallii]